MSFKSFLYHPVRARLLFDILIPAGISVVIWGLFTLFGLPTYSPFLMILMPAWFLSLNWLFGMYSSQKTAPVLWKTFALFVSSLAMVVVTTYVIDAFLLSVVLVGVFSWVLASMPRFFFNYSPRQNFSSYMRQLQGQKLPILVVGGAGYIGSFVVAKFLERGYKVRILDTFIYGRESLDEWEKNPDLEIIEGDVSDIYKLTVALSDVQAVVHLAGLVGDPACAVDDTLTSHVNIISTRLLKETAKAFGIPRFIFASSCSVYGTSEERVDENSSLNPVSLYARTKIDSEQELLNDQFDDFHPTILRFSTVFGHSRRMRFDLVANLFTAQAYNLGSINLMGSKQWRPFIHVADVAEAVVQATLAPLDKVSRQVFNVGDDRLNVTIGELAEIVADVVKKDKNGKPVKVVVNDDITDRRNYNVSFQKILKVLGFTSKYDLKKGIEEIHQNLKNKNYAKPFTDKIYSNVEMTKLVRDEFYTVDYQSKHISSMAGKTRSLNTA